MPRLRSPLSIISHAGCLLVLLFLTTTTSANRFQLTELDGNNGFTLNQTPGSSSETMDSTGIGDFDGDGIDDLLMGGSPGSAPGQFFIIYGSSSPIADIDLETIAAGDGSQGMVLQGDATQLVASFSGAAAGDFNGDGLADVMIGQSQSTVSDNPIFANFYGERNGAVYIVYGSSDRTRVSLTLADLSQMQGTTIMGSQTNAFAGGDVASAGDVNGDGVDDVIIGAISFFTPGWGFVVYGSVTPPATIALADILNGDNSLGFAATGSADMNNTGDQVAGVGDINNDGFDDVVIADNSANGGLGSASVIYGSDSLTQINLGALTGTNGFAINGSLPGDRIGFAVSSAGDFNGDGFDDILLGAPLITDSETDPNFSLSDNDGAAFVVYGGNNLSADFSIDAVRSGDGSLGFEITRDASTDGALLGRAVAPVGDFNGDGLPDILVNAPYARSPVEGSIPNFSEGETYIIYGDDGFASPSISVHDLVDGADGLVISSGMNSVRFGNVAAAAGDVNGDGLKDVLVTTRFNDQISVVFGWMNQGPEFQIDAERTIAANTASTVIDFTITDDITATENITVSATSSNAQLIPDSGITLAGTDSSRSLTLAPTPAMVGVATITLTAEDDTDLSTTQIFTLTVVDQTAPVITLLGDASPSLTVGTVFADAGVTASDDVDGDITANVTTTGTVDTATAGSYTLTYDVSDAAGNAAIAVTRTVQVNAAAVAPPAPAPSAGGGGGGSLGFLGLLVLVSVSLRRKLGFGPDNGVRVKLLYQAGHIN